MFSCVTRKWLDVCRTQPGEKKEAQTEQQGTKPKEERQTPKVNSPLGNGK